MRILENIRQLIFKIIEGIDDIHVSSGSYGYDKYYFNVILSPSGYDRTDVCNVMKNFELFGFSVQESKGILKKLNLISNVDAKVSINKDVADAIVKLVM